MDDTKNINQSRRQDVASTTETLPFVDPTINWKVPASLKHNIIITSGTYNYIQYSCDGIICFPRDYGSYLSWYNSTAGGVGSRMFDRQEAWDHAKGYNPQYRYPYNGGAAIIPGYGGYFLAVHLTDGSNIVQVNIIRRYLDDTILIYNTGKYGTSSYNISVTVNDPPGGYSVHTNGTRGTNTTTLAPGQYVLFFKSTAPAVDTASGLFSKSPFGVTKSQPYELWTNAFTHTGLNINIPKMYLGVKAPTDMEVISNGAYPGARLTTTPSGGASYPKMGPYPMMGLGGSDVVIASESGPPFETYNTSRIIDVFRPNIEIYKDETYSYTGGWEGGHQLFGAWFGWGEDEGGNVKFILLSQHGIAVDSSNIEKYRSYVAYIYNVERNEAYITHIVKPARDTGSYSQFGYPISHLISNEGSTKASAFAYIDANDTWHKITTGSSQSFEEVSNAYGFCNYYSDMINCVEGLGIYTTDTNYTPPAPKSAFGGYRENGEIGVHAIRIPSLGYRTLYAEKIYAMVARLKTFPGNTSDTDLQNWFKSLPPKSLTSNDYNNLLSILPGSFWLFGRNTDTVNMTAPSSANAGSQFTVNVSCSARPNTTTWVALVDGNGNIVASGVGVTDGSGNASVTLTAPSTPGTYKVLAIVKGDRQLV